LADAVAPLKLMTDEFALKVSPVIVEKFHGVEPAPPVIDHVPLPRLIVRVPAPEAFIPAAAESVTLLLLALKSSVPVNAPQVID
jgi:hypothetical protein